MSPQPLRVWSDRVSHFDLRQLRYFVVVAEEEHVGRAAARLRLSPSPLSRQVSQLERRLGVALFDRSRQRLALTAEGRAFLGEARALLDHADLVDRRAVALATGRAGSLRIGYVEGALHGPGLLDALRAFAAEHPDVRVELVRLGSAAQHDALHRGSLDVTFTYARPDDALETVRIADEPYVAAVPSGHPLAGERSLSPAALDGLPFVTVPRANVAAHHRLRQACAAAGFAPDFRYEAAEPQTALSFVASGLALALVQAGLASRPLPGVSFVPLGAFADRVEIWSSRRGTAAPAAVRLHELAVKCARAAAA